MPHLFSSACLVAQKKKTNFADVIFRGRVRRTCDLSSTPNFLHNVLNCSAASFPRWSINCFESQVLVNSTPPTLLNSSVEIGQMPFSVILQRESVFMRWINISLMPTKHLDSESLPTVVSDLKGKGERETQFALLYVFIFFLCHEFRI